jgi:hypothetical protein
MPASKKTATDKHAKLRDTVEEQSEDSFPASDAPSFAGGNTIGAPKGRRTKAPKKRPRHNR